MAVVLRDDLERETSEDERVRGGGGGKVKEWNKGGDIRREASLCSLRDVLWKEKGREGTAVRVKGAAWVDVAIEVEVEFGFGFKFGFKFDQS